MRIVIVEDHAVMRETLSTLVNRRTEHRVVSAVASAEKLLEELERVAFDLALVDLSLPGMSGDRLVARLLAVRPEVRTLIVSGHSAELYGGVAARVGADGYIMKDDPVGILEAIRAIAEDSTHPAGGNGV